MNLKPVTWSYSSLNKFLNCPKRYEEERVLRQVKQAPTEHTMWGETVHKALEVALTTRAPLEGEMKNYQPVVDRLQHIKGTFKAEQKLAITNSLKPAEWFAPDVWCRGILDAVWVDGEVAKIVDHKTGKRKRDSQQLKLFALLAFAHYPAVERINTAFVWLQTGHMDVEKYQRKDIPILWQDLLPAVRRLEYAHRTNTWIPKPGPLCRYCPVKSCSFWQGENGERGK